MLLIYRVAINLGTVIAIKAIKIVSSLPVYLDQFTNFNWLESCDTYLRSIHVRQKV